MDNIFIKGKLTFVDRKTKKVILSTSNLVVFSSRLLMMSLLVNSVPNNVENKLAIDLPTIDDKHRLVKYSICGFSVGNGGADVYATPVNPYVPKFNDYSLKSPIKFQDIDNSNTNNDYASNGYIKLLNTPPTWNIDSSTGQINVQYKLPFSNQDCGNQEFNELGLVLARCTYSKNGNNGYTTRQSIDLDTAKLATRVTFNPKILDSFNEFDAYYDLYI